MATVGELEEQRKKRKERLIALRAKKDGKTVGELTDSEKEAAALPKPIFRSYKPTDETLKENAIPAPKPVEVADQVKDQLAAGEPKPIIEEVDLASLATRKPDWDLKRDSSKKLEKLERRTKRAIANLIIQRVQSEKADGSSLATAVGTMNSSTTTTPQ